MTRVLVTGATSPVGRALVAALLDDPRTEFVVAAHGPADSAPPPEATRVPVEWVPVDLTRERDVRTLLFGVARRAGIDTLVHLALHRSARDHGARVHAQNVEALRTMLDLAERHPTLRRVVLRSHGEVYRIRHDAPTIVDEGHPLELSPRAPQWVRDRVETDLVACTRMGVSRMDVVVLRASECFAPESGSQLWDFLGSRVCFVPLGFDPMINVLHPTDLVDALRRSVFSGAFGVFNVPGRDTLPLSAAVLAARRVPVPIPTPALSPLYRLRAAVTGADFRYDQNHFRFHFGGILDGTRARTALGYVPRHAVDFAALDAARPGEAVAVDDSGGDRSLAFEPNKEIRK